DRRRPAGGGDGPAEARAARLVRGGERLLRLGAEIRFELLVLLAADLTARVALVDDVERRCRRSRPGRPCADGCGSLALGERRKDDLDDDPDPPEEDPE